MQSQLPWWAARGRSQGKVYVSVIPPRGKGAGVFIHEPTAIISWGLLQGGGFPDSFCLPRERWSRIWMPQTVLTQQNVGAGSWKLDPEVVRLMGRAGQWQVFYTALSQWHHSWVWALESECLDANSGCIVDLLCSLEQVTILTSVSSTVEYKWQWCQRQRAAIRVKQENTSESHEVPCPDRLRYYSDWGHSKS